MDSIDINSMDVGSAHDKAKKDMLRVLELVQRQSFLFDSEIDDISVMLSTTLTALIKQLDLIHDGAKNEMLSVIIQTLNAVYHTEAYPVCVELLISDLFDKKQFKDKLFILRTQLQKEIDDAKSDTKENKHH